MKKSLIVEIISSLLVVLFAYAAISKLLDYKTFQIQLGRSPYLARVSTLTVWLVPLSELFTATLLIITKKRLIGLYMSFFLMLLFTLYIYSMLHFSYYIPCSCGGVLSKMSWNQHLLFNIVFTGLALIGIILEKKPIPNSSILQIQQ